MPDPLAATAVGSHHQPAVTTCTNHPLPTRARRTTTQFNPHHHLHTPLAHLCGSAAAGYLWRCAQTNLNESQHAPVAVPSRCHRCRCAISAPPLLCAPPAPARHKRDAAAEVALNTARALVVYLARCRRRGQRRRGCRRLRTAALAPSRQRRTAAPPTRVTAANRAPLIPARSPAAYACVLLPRRCVCCFRARHFCRRARRTRLPASVRLLRRRRHRCHLSTSPLRCPRPPRRSSNCTPCCRCCC